MALLIEHGVRAGRVAAAAFSASPKLQRLTLADSQQRIEALRMYRRPMASVNVTAFVMGLQAVILPRLQFVAMHACALHFHARAAHAYQSMHDSSRYLEIAEADAKEVAAHRYSGESTAGCGAGQTGTVASTSCSAFTLPECTSSLVRTLVSKSSKRLAE